MRRQIRLTTTGRETNDVQAREVDGSERARLWDLVCTEFPMYATYQRRTKRTIPLSVLEPIGAADHARAR